VVATSGVSLFFLAVNPCCLAGKFSDPTLCRLTACFTVSSQDFHKIVDNKTHKKVCGTDRLPLYVFLLFLNHRITQHVE
jgi:hypothetical protein